VNDLKSNPFCKKCFSDTKINLDKIGKIIGKGYDGEVFEYDDDKVIKFSSYDDYYDKLSTRNPIDYQKKVFNIIKNENFTFTSKVFDFAFSNRNNCPNCVIGYFMVSEKLFEPQNKKEVDYICHEIHCMYNYCCGDNRNLTFNSRNTRISDHAKMFINKYINSGYLLYDMHSLNIMTNSIGQYKIIDFDRFYKIGCGFGKDVRYEM